MPRIGRYELSEISFNRLLFAFGARFSEIPHVVAWYSSLFANENRDRLRKYHNRHLGKRCFVVANGPSLLKMDLGLLRDEITFGLNRIYLSFGSTDFRPSYYLAVNELILEQFSNEI